MSTPPDILLARALSHFERAQLELDSNNDVTSAAEWIDKGLALVKEVLER